MKKGEGMTSDTINLFELDDINDALIKQTLREVNDALLERGYNPINQIVGYLMSGDPGFISSHRESRNKISKLDRNKILESLVRNYLKKK